MNRKNTTLLAAGLLASAFGLGCAQDTSDAAGHTDQLTLVSKAAIEAQTFYLNPAVSDLPLTAEQLGDTAGAKAVQIRFHDAFAVAWELDAAGVARVGDPAAVAVVWPLEGHVQLLSDDTVAPGGPGSTVVEPPAGSVRDVIPGVHVHAPSLPSALPPVDLFSNYPYARLNWVQRYLADQGEFRGLYPGGFHPGCY